MMSEQKRFVLQTLLIKVARLPSQRRYVAREHKHERMR